MHNRFDQCLGMTLLDRLDYVATARREHYADTRLGEINDGQPDEERGGRYYLEINQCFNAHATDFSQRAGTSDSDDNGRENKRRDDRFDQVNEDVAQKINFVSPFGGQPADHAANDQPDHDLHG